VRLTLRDHGGFFVSQEREFPEVVFQDRSADQKAFFPQEAIETDGRK
jgi:hypothetical protein